MTVSIIPFTKVVMWMRRKDLFNYCVTLKRDNMTRLQFFLSLVSMAAIPKKEEKNEEPQQYYIKGIDLWVALKRSNFTLKR